MAIKLRHHGGVIGFLLMYINSLSYNSNFLLDSFLLRIEEFQRR